MSFSLKSLGAATNRERPMIFCILRDAHLSFINHKISLRFEYYHDHFF